MSPAHSRQRDHEQSLRRIKELGSPEDQSVTQGGCPAAECVHEQEESNKLPLPPTFSWNDILKAAVRGTPLATTVELNCTSV